MLFHTCRKICQVKTANITGLECFSSEMFFVIIEEVRFQVSMGNLTCKSIVIEIKFAEGM